MSSKTALNFSNKHRISLGLLSLGLAAQLSAGCTSQLANSFRYQQAVETFGSVSNVDTKIDLLWVVDNSASMDTAQEKLRNGMTGFAQKYMKPTWDIRVAVITTDTYLANPAYSGYLNKIVPGTVGWASPYIVSRLGTFVNPSWNPSLVNLANGKFDNGVKYNELFPHWGPNYAKLTNGVHDGPITALCSELLGYFYRGVTNCHVRDNQALYTNDSHCITPGSGETSTSQCINTIENDVIHSGKAIISTIPPNGTPADASWTSQLIHDFIVNVTTGSAGQGSERGLQSMSQLLTDNEGTGSATAFFRAGSTRAIIFVSDEEDQSLTIPGSIPVGFTPQTSYACNQADLVAMNPAKNITGANGYCCSAVGCQYGASALTCPSKTIDGYTYSPSTCPPASDIKPVADYKTQLDSFFQTLDNSGVSGSPNYFVVSIVALTGATIQSMQTARDADDQAVATAPANYIQTKGIDRGDRYMQLGTLVGNGSLSMNIGDSDYSTLLDALGAALIAKKSTFQLNRAPTSNEDMIVAILRAGGTIEVLAQNQFSVNGKTLTITDTNVVLSFAVGDRVSVNYQPKTAF